MEKFYKKGHLKRKGKRLLTLLLCVCLIGTMIPVTARAEVGDTEVTLSENSVITDWEWVDDWEIIDPDSGNVLLPFASAENVAYFDDIVEMLPTAISAGGEELPLGEWVCEDYSMESGAYEGEYVFETTLPEGYVLSEDSNNLCLTVVLGNSDGYDAEVYAYEPVDTTLKPESTFDVSKIPMGCLTPCRYFIREEGTYTITGYNTKDTTARLVIYASCTIILDDVNLEAGITYEDRTDVYYGSATKDFTIAKKAATTVADINKSYVSTAGSKDAVVSIDIASLLPEDRGETTYNLAENTAVYVTEKAVTTDGKLTYKVASQNSARATTTLTVTATTENYENITVKVNITLTDKKVTVEKEGAKVAITGSNELIYGQKLSDLTLNTNTAKFVVDGTDEEVTGTLAWTNPDAVLDAGTTTAQWIFTPEDIENYTTLTGNLSIKVAQKVIKVNAVDQVIYAGENLQTATSEENVNPVISYEGFDGTEEQTEVINTADKPTVSAEEYDPSSPEVGNYVITVSTCGSVKADAAKNYKLENAKNLFTEAEAAAVKGNGNTDGKNALLYLKLSDADQTVTETEKNAIENKMKSVVAQDANVGKYLDVSLFLKIAQTSNRQITDTSKTASGEDKGFKVKVTIDIPSNIPSVKTGYKRTYKIIRAHYNDSGNLETEALETIQSGNQLTFEKDKFSVYAITYKDADKPSVPVETDKPSVIITPEPTTPAEMEKPPVSATPDVTVTPAAPTPSIEPTAPVGSDAPKDTAAPEVSATPTVTATPKPTATPTKVTSDFGTLKARSVKQTKTTVTLKWAKVSKADGYLIYGSKCNTKGKTYTKKLLKTIKGNGTLTWTQKKLEKATFYKYQVKAYKLVDGKKVIIAQSVDVHTVTKGGKYSVAGTVKVTKLAGKKVSGSSLKLIVTKGRTAQIKATETPAEKNKTIKCHRALSYESSNSKVATVTKNGKIKAVGKQKKIIQGL